MFSLSILRFKCNLASGKISNKKIFIIKDLFHHPGKGKSDPYAIITVGAQQWKTKHIDNNVNPRWDYWCEVRITKMLLGIFLSYIYTTSFLVIYELLNSESQYFEDCSSVDTNFCIL